MGLIGLALLSVLIASLMLASAPAQIYEIVTYSNSTQTGYHVLNSSPLATATLALGVNTYRITQNFETPTNIGLTVNDRSYTLNTGVPMGLAGYSNTYLDLVSISYIPRLHSADYNIYYTITATTTIQESSTSTAMPATIAAATTAMATAATTVPATIAAHAKAVLQPGLLIYAAVAIIIVGVVAYLLARRSRRRR